MLVVPTSTRRAPLWVITSGMRKAPPISTNSPREMTTSPPGRGPQSEQHGGGVVVGDQGGLGAGQGAQQFLGLPAAPAALAGPEVHLQVGVARCDLPDGLDGLGGERGAAQVRVDDDPGRVDDALETGPVEVFQVAADGGEELVEEKWVRLRPAAAQSSANILQARPDRRQDRRTGILGEKRPRGGRFEQGVDGGILAGSRSYQPSILPGQRR